MLRYSLGSIASKGESIHLGGEEIDVPWNKSRVRLLIRDKVASIVERAGCKTHTIYLSEGKNFRFETATTVPYKECRSPTARPFHWKTVGDIFREDYPTISTTEFEADDELASAQFRALDSGYSTTCICTVDKDLLMVSGWHYKWQNGEHQPERPVHWVDDDNGMRWFWKQMLTGDWSTDRILGCAHLEEYIGKSGKRKGELQVRRKGIGDKRAEVLLGASEDLIRTVWDCYVSEFGTEARGKFLEMADLLWMCIRMKPFSKDEVCMDMVKNYIGK